MLDLLLLFVECSIKMLIMYWLFDKLFYFLIKSFPCNSLDDKESKYEKLLFGKGERNE